MHQGPLGLFFFFESTVANKYGADKCICSSESVIIIPHTHAHAHTYIETRAHTNF